MATRFYRYHQNNSGGYYIVNNEVSENVIIEASSEEDANEKFEYLIQGNSSFCECCGRRWSDEPHEEMRFPMEFTHTNYLDEDVVCKFKGLDVSLDVENDYTVLVKNLFEYIKYLKIMNEKFIIHLENGTTLNS